jgi:hypothetical protein
MGYHIDRRHGVMGYAGAIILALVFFIFQEDITVHYFFSFSSDQSYYVIHDSL